MTQVGFPANAEVPVSGQAIEGGIVLNDWIRGDSGLSRPTTSPVHAAIALWGVGVVRKNGQLVSYRALIVAQALDTGTHADDGTFRLQPRIRPRDGEIHVVALFAANEIEPKGYVQFGFDDVRLTVGSDDLPLANSVATEEGIEVGSSYGTGGAGLYAGGYVVSSTSGILVPAPRPDEAAPTGRPGEEVDAIRAATMGSDFAQELARGEPVRANEPLNSSPAVPLPQTPGPLNAEAATPLVIAPMPLNAQPATPLPKSEPPLNTTPIERPGLPQPIPTNPSANPPANAGAPLVAPTPQASGATVPIAKAAPGVPAPVAPTAPAQATTVPMPSAAPTPSAAPAPGSGGGVSISIP
jgi:hypothetical protein